MAPAQTSLRAARVFAFDTTNATAAVTMPGNLNFNGGLLKFGAGTLNLTGNNSYPGNTTISVGTLALGNANAAQNSTVVVNVANGLQFAPSIGTFNIGGLSGSSSFAIQDTSGGTNTLLNDGSNGQSTTYTGILSGGSLGITGGALTLTAANTYKGGTTISGGTLQLGEGISGKDGTITGAIKNNGTLAFDLFASQSNSTAITGTGALALQSGTLTLTGSNSYSGGTTVSGGILDFSVTAAQPASGLTTVANVDALALGVGTASANFNSAAVDGLFTNALPNVSIASSAGIGIDTSAGNFTYATSNAGSNSLVKLGANMLTLTGTSSYSGSTTVSGGSLNVAYLTAGGQPSNIGAASNAPGNIVPNTGTLLYTGSSVSIDRGFTAAGGTLNIAGGQTLSTSGAVNVTSVSANGLTIYGNLNLSGSVSIFNATSNGLVLPTGGYLTTTGIVTNPNGNIILQGGTLNVAGGSFVTGRHSAPRLCLIINLIAYPNFSANVCPQNLFARGQFYFHFRVEH